MLHRTAVVLLIIVSCTGFVLTFISEELRVTLPNGSKLVGRYLRSFSGRTIKGFTNIPYAKPPIGPLRFKVSFISYGFSPISHNSSGEKTVELD